MALAKAVRTRKAVKTPISARQGYRREGMGRGTVRVPHLIQSCRRHCEKRNRQSGSLFAMPVAGLEPARLAALDFESSTSANSITPAGA